MYFPGLIFYFLVTSSQSPLPIPSLSLFFFFTTSGVHSLFLHYFLPTFTPLAIAFKLMALDTIFTPLSPVQTLPNPRLTFSAACSTFSLETSRAQHIQAEFLISPRPPHHTYVKHASPVTLSFSTDSSAVLPLAWG